MYRSAPLFPPFHALDDYDEMPKQKIDLKLNQELLEKSELSDRENFLRQSSILSRQKRGIQDCPDPSNDPTCDFISIENSTDFREVFTDCSGSALKSGSGRWFEPVTPFAGKDRTRYHIPEENLGLREVVYSTADQYCKDLNVNHSYLWCPQSEEENFYLWYHHNGQPFGGTDGPSVWTGILRLQSSGIFGNDGWQCHDFYDQSYFNWISGQPSFFNLYSFLSEFNTVLTCNTPQWDDIADSDPAAIVCEMMCDIFTDEATTAEPETAAETTAQATTIAAPTTAPICDQLTQTGVHSVSISTAMGAGLADMLSNVICQETLEQIQLHGCHCIRLGDYAFTVDYAGGSAKLDAVDKNCKQWHDARKCLGLQGGSCYNTLLGDQYRMVLD